ncbi:class I SAM-dependent methyltransferase [Thalassotalea litorea]|uniref:class I SAM-dependent methyltransferase n=1 Tax=Thalassotalea litorea TaxID=2020715 RepID=UPI0037351BF4
MNQDESYMKDFMTVFQELERWGPGNKQESLHAFSLVPITPQHILEIGCGKGLTTLALAKASHSQITAVDNEPDALQSLNAALISKGLTKQVNTVCASMTDLPFPQESFDVIWAEGCAYIMGVQNAIKEWRALLQPGGVMVLSDLVWLSSTPDQQSKDFFSSEYPDMQSVATRIDQFNRENFDVLHHFSLSEQAWENYYQPLKQRAVALTAVMPCSQALKDILSEVELYEQHLGEFGYQMFIVQKR